MGGRFQPMIRNDWGGQDYLLLSSRRGNERGNANKQHTK